MARKYRNEVLAGIFIITSSILFFLVLFLMGSFENIFQPMRTLVVKFNDVQGLREGDPVFLLGVKVGKVQSLQFDTESDPTQVTVNLGIPQRSWPFLTDDATVLVDKSITGNLKVDIRNLEGEPIADRTDVPPLRGQVAFDMVETAARVQTMLGDVSEVVDDLATMLARVEKSGVVEGTLKDIRETIAVIRDRSDPVAGNLEKIAATLEAILSENREGIKQAVDSLAHSAEVVERFTERLEPARRSIQEAMDELKQVSADLDRLVVSNQGYVGGILKDLREASATVNNLTAEIKRRPWRLLYKPEEAEVEAFDLYDAAWAYNLSATTLNLSVQELASLSRHADRVDRDLIDRALKNVEASLKRQKQAEEQFYALFREQAGS